jgi:HEPN domain-containing protein
MSNVNDPLDWAKYADQDWLMAKSALRRKTPLPLPACFHAQQCAEKCLKALLIAQSAPFPKTHDLLTLDNLCNQAGVITGFSPIDLTVLADHAVEARYPGNEPNIQDAKEAIGIAKTVRNFTRKWLGIA